MGLGHSIGTGHNQFSADEVVGSAGNRGCLAQSLSGRSTVDPFCFGGFHSAERRVFDGAILVEVPGIGAHCADAAEVAGRTDFPSPLKTGTGPETIDVREGAAVHDTAGAGPVGLFLGLPAVFDQGQLPAHQFVGPAIAGIGFLQRGEIAVAQAGRRSPEIDASVGSEP